MTWQVMSRASFAEVLAQPEVPFLLLDIRTREQFDTVHVRGSQHCDSLNLRAFAEQAARNTPLILICRRGISSRHAAMWFDQLGFSTIHTLNGGVEGLQQHMPDLLITTEKEM